LNFFKLILGKSANDIQFNVKFLTPQGLPKAVQFVFYDSAIKFKLDRQVIPSRRLPKRCQLIPKCGQIKTYFQQKLCVLCHDFAPASLVS
jgi:hypothetical protein